MDRILDVLNRAELETDDIVVMCTELNAYAPFIHSVFGQRKKGMPLLNYTIADRTVGEMSLVAEFLHDLFVLTRGRFTVGEVMGIIAHPICAAHHRFSLEDIDTMRVLSLKSGFRWGYDKQHRDRVVGAAFDEHSWMQAKKRILLGICYDDDELRDGTVAEVIEEQDTHIIGAYFDVVHKLWTFYEFAQQAQNTEHWSQMLWDLYKGLFEGAQDADEHLSSFSQAISKLSEIWEGEAMDMKLPSKVVEESIDQLMGEEMGSTGFLQGGITFCKMLPMRNIPIKMTCILGLGILDFPRSPASTWHRPDGRPVRPLGDRSPRLDDRYLFLETLMSTQATPHQLCGTIHL